MNKVMKIFYSLVIGLNVLAGATSLICQNYLLGTNQLLLAWFMFLHFKETEK